jgi:hypothetical protein
MRSILLAQKNVLEQNTTKALVPTGVLWKPKCPNRAFCSYRVLHDDFLTPSYSHILPWTAKYGTIIFYIIFFCE